MSRIDFSVGFTYAYYVFAEFQVFSILIYKLVIIREEANDCGKRLYIHIKFTIKSYLKYNENFKNIIVVYETFFLVINFKTDIYMEMFEFFFSKF